MFIDVKCAGWTPQSFKSSRKNRAEVKAQSVYSFLDEDEKEVWFIMLFQNVYFLDISYLLSSAMLVTAAFS